MTNQQTVISVAGSTRPGNALAVAERSFQLLITGPNPLAIDGRSVGHGLPARSVDLGELRTLLLGPAADDDLKDGAWADLVRRARVGDPAWVLGCVGVAMPGLKNTAARVLRSSPARFADDIVSELLIEFVAQLAQIDIGRPRIPARLMLWARKGALRARGREAFLVPCDPWELPDRADASGADPVTLLLDAARKKIITPAAAELIISTRLDGMSVQAIARDRRVPASKLYRQREAAETRLVAAIRDGDLSSMHSDLSCEG
ncbi:hypothetical protein [Spirillospora sp. NBC_01491]|uniref:hypothetical protein n=1 Tax=Spirillospora sp. NBC_01491 TaxID=2976007 RepID=UPI002E3792EC|nr:hypothetical protein [Spirillospora sp. NBC_01491]